MTPEEMLANHNKRHKLFHYAPRLRELPETVVTDFFAWAETAGVRFNWALHLHCLEWLNSQSIPLEELFIQSLLSAAATRWALAGLEHVTAKGMLLASKHWPGYAVGVWKSVRADQAASIVILQIPEGTAHGFHETTEAGNWGEIRWLPYP